MSKLNLYIIIGVIIAIVSLTGLWRYEASCHKQLQKENTELSIKNNHLNEENERLQKYYKEKDKIITELNKQYSNLLNNIPADTCGDMVPSKELLEYFKKGMVE